MYKMPAFPEFFFPFWDVFEQAFPMLYGTEEDL